MHVVAVGSGHSHRARFEATSTSSGRCLISECPWLLHAQSPNIRLGWNRSRIATEMSEDCCCGRNLPAGRNHKTCLERILECRTTEPSRLGGCKQAIQGPREVSGPAIREGYHGTHFRELQGAAGQSVRDSEVGNEKWS